MNKTLRRILYCLPMVLIILLFLLTLYRDSELKVVRSKYRSPVIEAEGTGIIYANGQPVFVFDGKLPDSVEVPKTDCITMETYLKAFYELRDYDAYLSFQSSKAEIEVYFEDELIFSRKYPDSSARYLHSYEGVAQNCIKLPPDYKNGKLKIVFSYPDKTVTSLKLRPIYIGNESAVRIRNILLGFTPLVFGWLLMLLAVFILIIGLMNRKSKNYSLFSVFYYILVIGLWLASQSLSRFVILDNSAIHSQFSYLALFTLPLSVAFVVSAYYLEKTNRFIRVMKRVALAFFLSYAVFELRDLTSKFQMQTLLPLSGAFALFYIILIIAYLIVLKTLNKRKRLTRIILVLSFTCCAIFFDEVFLLIELRLNSTLAFFLLYLPYIVATVILVRDISGYYIREQKNCYAKDVLFDLYSTDPLSGAFTRDYFNYRQSNRTLNISHNYLIIYADIDSMKVINDTKGHLAGDEAIKSLGKTVDTLFFSSRKKPLFVRMGGDEFLLVINLDSHEELKAEELVQRLEDTYELIAEGNATITTGYAYSGLGLSMKQTIEKADAMLLERKKNKKVNSTRIL